MELPYPTLIPGLRSPSDQVKGIVYFGRMLDKIRLAAAGKLPEEWQVWRGTTLNTNFDSRCCNFHHIDYAALEAETLKDGSDEELLTWAFAHGRQPSEEEIEVWNAFMTKRGWLDAGTQPLNERLAEIGRRTSGCRAVLRCSRSHLITTSRGYTKLRAKKNINFSGQLFR